MSIPYPQKLQYKLQVGQRLKGAVAVVVAICISMLVGLLALVLDLGHLYLVKSGLQNGADAAALAGALELNGSRAGVNSAIDKAIRISRENNYAFSNPVGTTSADGGLDMFVGSCPDDGSCTMVPVASITTDSDAAGKTFLKVDTRLRTIDTWFAPVLALLGDSDFSTTQTFGMAVAGRYTVPITPIGVCALRATRETWVKYGAGANDEYKVEYGYVRGVNYDLSAVNEHLSGLASGTKLYIHPTATSGAECSANEGNADFSAPFLCKGQSSIAATFGSTVYTNTGLAAGKSIAAINTRFDRYGSPLDAMLDSSVCAPDDNVRQYTPVVATNWMAATPPPLPILDQAAIYGLADWLAGPVGGGIRSATPPDALMNENENKGGCDAECSDNYGVLWSYTRPVKKSGSFTVSDWPALYPAGTKTLSSSSYPEPSPYSSGLSTHDSKYFLAPTHPVSGALESRRILNVLVVSCPAPSGGICRPINVMGVGKFFMQRQAENSAWVTGEFAGLIPESKLSSSDVRLYR